MHCDICDDCILSMPSREVYAIFFIMILKWIILFNDIYILLKNHDKCVYFLSIFHSKLSNLILTPIPTTITTTEITNTLNPVLVTRQHISMDGHRKKKKKHIHIKQHLNYREGFINRRSMSLQEDWEPAWKLSTSNKF